MITRVEQCSVCHLACNHVEQQYLRIESVVTSVQVQGQQLKVAVLYRSPGVSVQQLVQHMTTLLEYVNIATVIVGDFNDDVICESGSQVFSSKVTYIASRSDGDTSHFFSCCLPSKYPRL